jgi:ParB-like chromosome segregation protein Spo0J
MAAGLKTGGRIKGTPNKATSGRILPGRGVALPPYRLTPIEQLVPYARNARTHTDAQVSKIAASILEFGFTNPVLVDGDRGIIAGHGRVLAARTLAMDAVPTIELAHLSEAQKRAYVLADNRLALDAGWDDALLRLELGELRATEFDLGLTGFDGTELNALFAEPRLPGPQPEPPAAASVACPECGHVFVPSREHSSAPAPAAE